MRTRRMRWWPLLGMLGLLLLPALAEAGSRHGHGGGHRMVRGGHHHGHVRGYGGHQGHVRGYAGWGHRPYSGGWWRPYYGYYPWRSYYGYYPYKPFVPLYPIRPYVYPPAVYFSVPSAVYWPPVSYTYVAPAPSLIYNEPPAAGAAPGQPASGQAPTEVVYPTGKYVLRGDGVNSPYEWVWIPNPPPAPPPPPAIAPESDRPPRP